MADLFHVIYLTGAPATGKSTLVQALVNSVKPLAAISYSARLKDYIARRDQREVDTQELRARSSGVVTPDDIEVIDGLLIEEVQHLRQHAHVVIDSHPVTKEAYGFRITAFSVAKLQAVRPTMICMLYAEPEVVVERIQIDPQGRQGVSHAEAAFHTELQSSVAAIYGVLLGVPVYLFDSSKPVEEIAEAIILRLERQNPTTRRVTA